MMFGNAPGFRTADISEIDAGFLVRKAIGANLEAL